MIFVTVGTHEQQFNRLVKYMDEWAAENDEDVVVQTGYSDYEPQNCSWSKFYTYEQMLDLVNKARIVITHGGPSSFIMPLQIRKIPIVVPRNYKFDEHVNNHQINFARAVANRQGNIIVVEKIHKLGEVIENYNSTIATMQNELASNNKVFCRKFEYIIENRMKRKR